MKTSGYWLLTAHNFTGFPEGKEPKWLHKRDHERYGAKWLDFYYKGNPRRHEYFSVLTTQEDAKARASDLLSFCQMVSLGWVSHIHQSKLLGTLNRNKEWRWKPE
jgi:hypothetical protein